MSILDRILGMFFNYNFLEIELTGQIPEEKEQSFLPFMSRNRKLTLWEVEKLLTYVENDAGIEGVIIKLSELGVGLGRANGIRERLRALREKGKRVIVYLESGGNVEYLIASSGESIYIPPWGMLNLIGLKAELTFYKDALSKLGVKAYMKGLGEYKSAAETFTRDSMSEPHREMIDSLTGDLEAQLELSISEGRGIGAGEVKRLVDQGPYTARGAFECGLTDGVAYETELEDLIRESCGIKIKTIKAHRLLRFINLKDSLKSAVGRIAGKRNIVAVVSMTGIITSGRSRGSGALKTMGASSLIGMLEGVEADRRVVAVVLRVLTPGGSGVASDLLRNKLKMISRKKPVVVSMSDVATSGGYLIALGADKVVTDPMSLTGSIGIVSGKFDLSGLYQKLGVKKESVSQGKRALMFSVNRGFTEDEDEKLGQIIASYYREFVKVVSEERAMDMSSAESAARGRVWTGKQAKELGLVDELGGLTDAFRIAVRESGLGDDSQAVVKFISEKRGIQISEVLGTESLLRALDHVFESLSSLTRERFLAIMPYDIDVR